MCNCNYNIHQHYFHLNCIQDIYNRSPLLITGIVSKIRTNKNTFLLLYGALARMCKYNDKLMDDLGLTMSDVINSAFIIDNELILNNTYGYAINDRYILNSLFLSDSGIILSVFDNKKDRYLNFKVN